jgi:2-amino-4-hydroxy-6-hydroxymethyldihydropteridine diphosphokinase
MHRVYLGLGSNLGDRRWNIAEAVRFISERVGQVTRQSSLIETEPWGFESQNKFLNAVVLCETTKSPREVLQLTQQIERDMGRNRKTQHSTYTDRPIDIDILLYDDITVDEPDLQIPHPLMYQRDFVMIPLREINDNGNVNGNGLRAPLAYTFRCKNDNDNENEKR